MNHEEILALYDRRRAASRPIANELIRRIGKGAIGEAARALGLWERGTVVLDAESDLDVLADLCIFDRWTDGENLVRRVMRTDPAEPGTVEREIMEAKRDARFSLFASGRTEPGVGVYFNDVIRGGAEVFVVDRGMALTGAAGVMAMRLLEFPEFAMTTGAGIPVRSREASEDVLDALRRRFGAYDGEALAAMSPQEWSEFAFITVKRLLAHRQTRHIAYADRPDLVDPRELSREVYEPELMGREPVRAEPRVGRNEPCPCGSGKKFKKCHGAAGAG